MTSWLTKGRIAASISLAALIAAAPAQAKRPMLPDRIELGRDAGGEPCVATRYWTDMAVSDYFADSYSITCRSATATRFLGLARAVDQADDIATLNKSLTCSASMAVQIPRLGSGQARSCFDSLLGLSTVETTVQHAGRHLSVSAIPALQGPAEEALRLLAGVAAPDPDRNRTVAPAVMVADLPPPPEGMADAALAANSEAALQQGLRMIRQGLHNEASRVLNDALSRLSPDAPVASRVELLLVSGLADSNLRFFDSAESYFTRADALLAANPGLPEGEVLTRKRRSYGALDQLNRRNFSDAIAALDRLAVRSADPGQPLTDPATIRMLNQLGETGTSGVVASPDVAGLSRIVIDAQANWARSIALLAQNKPDEAAQALDAADRNFAVLRGEPVDQRQVSWLDARIERQRARILSRQGDQDAAVAALDRATVKLIEAGAQGAAFGPTLAETQLERAALNSRRVPRAQALDEFEAAIGTLVSSDSSGGVLPPAVEQYLELLIADAAENPSGTATERFFRAIQAVGDPAVARQFVELQSVVATDSALAAKVQDRDEIERELTRLRFEIAGTPNDQGAGIAALDARRAALEPQLIALNTELQSSRSFRVVSDQPVKLAELRDALNPGQVFWKITPLRNYVFGIAVDSQGAQIYRLAQPLKVVDLVAARVRDSIDGGQDNTLPVFDVSASNALWQLLAGPAAARLTGATSVVIDPSGPFETVPAGVLVTNSDDAKTFAVARNLGRQYDYSYVSFMARQTALSSALSPRSLIVARQEGSSDAPLPFIGFAEHLPTTFSGQMGDTMVSIGTGCVIDRKEVARLSNSLSPINRSELVKAEAALGVSGAPMVTGAEFTDTALKQRTDLDQFQVLHFATHGLTEGQWGCAKAPPALVTSQGDSQSDGILSFDEIARLRLNANLVVLSACQTASALSIEQARLAGQEESGATLEGLIRSFLAANARAVLSTYWPISDEGESEDLIRVFYGAARNGTIGGALRTAQNNLISTPKTSHPIYWGAFFVVGDADKPLITGAARERLAANGGTDGAGAVRK